MAKAKMKTCEACGQPILEERAASEIPLGEPVPESMEQYPMLARSLQLRRQWPQLVRRWVAKFPGLDVEKELLKLDDWALYNPAKFAAWKNKPRALGNCLQEAFRQEKERIEIEAQANQSSGKHRDVDAELDQFFDRMQGDGA